MSIKVKGLEPLQGLWWRVACEMGKGVYLELVGPDTQKYEAYKNAAGTIEKLIGLPGESLWKLIEKIRPDIKQEAWSCVYLRAIFPKDQVSGEAPDY